MPIIQKSYHFGNENLSIDRNDSYGLYALQSPSPQSDSEEIVEKQYPERAEEQTLRFFNPDLAIAVQKKLKAKKPDITGAFILSYLQSWKKAASRRFAGSRVQNAVYRSLEQIQDNLPWIDKATVHRAIGRLEKALPKDFKVYRLGTKVLNYSISSKLMDEYFNNANGKQRKKPRYLSVYVEDAKKHGILEAVLVRNLEFKTQPLNVSNPVIDQTGRIYGEMSAVKLTSPRKSDNVIDDIKAGILPFGRQAVQEAISKLKSTRIFVEHNERGGFYTLDRGRNDPGNDRENEQNRLSSNATVVSPNATVVSSNAIDLSPNATVSSVQIERERNELGNEIESDNKTSSISPLARPAEASLAFEYPNLELLNLDESEFGLSDDPLIEVSPDPSIPSIQSSLDSTPVHLPLFFSDEFPDLIVELNDRVQKLRNARKTPFEHIARYDLPFDHATSYNRLSWLENQLFLNPITEQPIDWSNFEEQIDVAVYELLDDLVIFKNLPKEDMLEFRDHFKTYEGLSIQMVRKMLGRISEVIVDPEYHRTQRGKFDHYYFAKRIKTLKTFNRYFKQLFRETFAPYVNETGEYRFVGHVRLRWRPVGESFDDGEYEYPLTDSPENMEEPFRTILKDAIEEEHEKMLACGTTSADALDTSAAEIEGKSRNPRIELLPIHEELPAIGFSSAKQHDHGGVEEYSVLWHLMKRLGLDVTGKDSGFPYFQISGGGMETVG